MTTEASDTPLCSSCGRPLQRGRTSCIYCGKLLTEKQQQELGKKLSDETVQKRLKSAQAILNASSTQMLSSKGRLILKIIVTVLSAASALFISWISEWNPVFIVLALLFFSLPVWHVFRKT